MIEKKHMKKEDKLEAAILRQKAEEMMKKKTSKNGMQPSEVETLKLIHELEVHQIELELQNEELRQANETAEMALKKYTMLYDFASMGYFTLDADGSICDLNFTGAEILRDKRIVSVNSNFKLFVADDSKIKFNNFLNKIYSSNAKESCEVMLGYDNHLLGYVYMEGVVTGDDRKCLLSVIDISSIKKQIEP